MSIKSGCLFCTETEPCVTHAGVEKKKRPRKLKASEPSVSTSISTPSIESDISLDFVAQKKKSRFAPRVLETQEQSEDDLIEREAVRNLWDLLSGGTRAQWRKVVFPPKNALLSKKAAEVRRDISGDSYRPPGSVS